ncbi:MAG: zinc ribbon domain-containing protein [Deltaproteobacteria bacterium]|nr:zinc ribbon domain-containing protein [Deltaproteobacteria bacterium]
MPIYEYECTECGRHTEAMQKFSDSPVSECDACHGKMKKLISQSTFHLKGTGWYVTDYASKTGRNQAKSSGAESRSESDKPKAEAKSSQKGDSSKGGESSKASKKKDSSSK